MKNRKVIFVLSVAVVLSIVAIARQEDQIALEACAYSSSCQSYEVLEATSLDELKNHIREGLGNAGWQPRGGVVYDEQAKRYLQVMVHPRKLPSYP